MTPQAVTKLQLVRAMRTRRLSVPTTKLSADQKHDWAAMHVVSRGDPLLRSIAKHLGKGQRDIDEILREAAEL